MATFEKAYFCIDAIPNERFHGYTNGDNWNGFACPCFEKGLAEQVLNASKVNGYVSNYDAENDTFIVQSKDDPPEYAPQEFKGQFVTIDEKEIKVYPVGAYSWIWGICS